MQIKVVPRTCLHVLPRGKCTVDRVGHRQSIEAQARTYIPLRNHGVLSGSEDLPVPIRRSGTRHEAGSIEGIGTELSICSALFLGVDERKDDGASWVGCRMSLCVAEVSIRGNVATLATRNLDVLDHISNL